MAEVDAESAGRVDDVVDHLGRQHGLDAAEVIEDRDLEAVDEDPRVGGRAAADHETGLRAEALDVRDARQVLDRAHLPRT